MEKKPCPVCTRLNDPQDTHCWFCHAELTPSKEEPAADWLSGLRQEEETLMGQIDNPSAPAGEEESKEEQGEFVPDWLARIRSREASEKAEKQALEERYWAEKKSREGLPDWLRSLNEDAAGGSGAEAAQGAAGQSKSDATQPFTPPAAGDDWLDSLKSWQPAEPAAPAEPATEAPLPPNEAQGEPAFLPENPLGQEAQDTPESEIDLGKIFSPLEQPAEAAPEAPDGLPESPLPDGFAALDATPDFLQEDTASKEENVSAPFAATASQEAPFAPESPFIEPGTQQPEALPAMAESPAGEQTPSETPAFIGSLEETASIKTLPGDDLQQVPTSEPEQEPAGNGEFLPEEFELGDLPDWLADIKPNEALPPAPAAPHKVVPAAVDDGSPQPEKANLPAWLQSRRPVEAVTTLPAPIEKDAEEQGTKPRDILAESITEVSAPAAFVKPSDLGGGLNVSNRQRTNATLLSVLLSNAETLEEAEAVPGAPQRRTLFRFLLALAFIVIAVLGSTLLNSYRLYPALYPEEVVHTFDTINSLPLEKPVLVAGDYEAGFSGEVRLSSQALLEHLMRRGLNIALLSLNPVDSALLPDQVARAAAAVPGYPSSAKVVDLGYLPGGGVAIQSLGSSFASTVPLTADLQPVASSALLHGVTNLSDFGAVVVITDKSETARTWIEQVQPLLGGTPLLLITSAQASPLVQPYYQSGQVTGLVSGMFGGMIYERVLGSAGGADGSFVSLQLILALMACLALLGGFISLVRPATHGRKTP